MRKILLTFFAALICATSMEASPAVAVNGKLPNAFSVSANKKVWFSQGNLQYVGSWQFASNQWDYFGTSQSNNHRDLFGWGTGNAPNKVSVINTEYSTFTDWGANAITNGGNTANQWRTLTDAEWGYLFNSRTPGNSVNGVSNARYTEATINTDGTAVNGIILFPDDAVMTSVSGVTWGTINSSSAWGTRCTTAGWTALETAGCVFLPAAGYRNGTTVNDAGSDGNYWSSTANGAARAYGLYFRSGVVYPQEYNSRYHGNSVRLVSETAPPARVTSAPTAKSGTITYSGSAKTLFNTGTASGGTMKYQVTTTNSKPGKNSGTWSNNISNQTNAGTYYLWYYVYHDANHIDSDVFGPVTKAISKATPTVTAPTPKSLTYTGSAQTLVNTGSTTGGTLQYKLGSGSWGTSIPTATAAGNYTVYYKVEGNSNYNAVAEQSVSVTINKAPLTCTADNKSVDYNSNPPTYTATYSGWKNSETASVISGTLSYSCSYAKGSNAGSYTITPSGVTASNYTITFQTGTLTVNKINPTVTAPTTKSLTYNGSAQALVNAGSTTGGTLQYSLSSGTGYGDAIPTQTNAGTYTVYYKVNGNTNYNAVAEASVSVTINQAPLTCTADNKSVTYGDAAPTYTVSYGGWKGSDNTSVLSGPLAFACDYSASSNVGDYTITPSGVTASNYAITFNTGTLTVNPAPLTITADNKEIIYNAAAPTYTATYDGFVNSETQAVLTGTLAFACDYSAGSDVDDYTITPSGVTSGNYTITFNTGTLTVNKADAVITDVPAAIEGLVYTGSAQTLISAGTATGGELHYKVDASAWSTDLPQATAIGDHTVYYKVVGDGNHNSIDESSFTVSIAAVTVLYDNTDPTTDIAGMVEAGEAYDLTVSRTIYADGYFNTICLPFAVSAGELSDPAYPLYGYTDLKTFSGAEVTGSGQNLFINIYVEDATEIAAGVPYLISYPGNRADILNPTFPAAVCTATTPGAVAHDGVTFQGMFAPVHITTYAENTTEDYLFLGENNRLLWPNDDGSSMRGFRAYFIIHHNNIPAAAAPRGTAARIMQRDNTATGIEQVQGDEVQSTKLLRDGQLIIIRNGVEYNANGQMLK